MHLIKAAFARFCGYSIIFKIFINLSLGNRSIHFVDGAYEESFRVYVGIAFVAFGGVSGKTYRVLC